MIPVYGVPNDIWERAWIKSGPMNGELPMMQIKESGPLRPRLKVLIDSANEPGSGIGGLIQDIAIMTEIERRAAG